MPAPSARSVLGRASGTKALIAPGRVDDRRGVIHSSAVSGVELPGLVDLAAFQASDVDQLGNVAAHVLSFGVEAFRLGEGIEDPVRPGVGSGARHPLPVQLIVGDVSVDEQVEKVAGAQSSVDVERLGQEAGDDEPGAVVHPPLPLQLPHSRIDDRVSGTPVAPGRQLLLVAAPMRVVGAVVVVGGVGTRGEGLVVEVAPRDLPDERPRPFGAGTRTVHEFCGGQAAEVQVGR